ncbi:MAG: flagellar basal body-associated protein FliL [Beijerinckiaceae bacterium]
MAKKKKAADDGTDGAAPETKSGKKKLIIMLAAALLIAGGGGGWFFLMRKPAEAVADNAAKGAMAKKVAFVELKEMTINLAAAAGQERQNFLKLKIALEVSDPKLSTDIQPLVPRIEDAFQTYMRELRANEIDGSSAMYRLKEELLKRVNIAVYPAKVDAVLFKEVLLQ